jgi:FtsP/CotA-like multicopper oxidase with cupredoxin domain
MDQPIVARSKRFLLAAAALATLAGSPASAAIESVFIADGATLTLTARTGAVAGGDGLFLHVWGYQRSGMPVQYPGPTLRMAVGSTVHVELHNQLAEPTSMLFPGMSGVSASGSVLETQDGVLTKEVLPGGSITYTFTASRPGTYYYQSGTEPDQQVELGLFGALIVDPTTPGQAYDDSAAICPENVSSGPNVVCSSYDREYLVLASEMDERIHSATQDGEDPDTTSFHPVYWFINGRNFPDTLLPDHTPLLPTQPYSALARMHPGERVLIRMIGLGRDLHAFHTHGNHMLVIAEDARLRASATSSGADLARQSFTFTIAPGQTADAIYSWTGAALGWDIYGHAQDRDETPSGNFPGAEDVDHDGDGTLDAVALQPHEDAADHGKRFPTPLLNPLSTAFGAWWSGSPFLGSCGPLPPGQGGFNGTCAIPMMWHNHKDIALVNNDIFPGGMMTILFIEHPDVPIP